MLESTGLIGQRDTGIAPLPLWTSTIELKEEGEDSEFQDEWRTGQMMLVADGSAKNGFGTGAWIFTSLRLYEQGKYIEASALSPGPEYSQDSHRAECIGLLGGLRMVQQKLHSWRVESGHIVVACDNISALKYAVLQSKYKYIHSKIPDYDVLQACRSVMEPGVDYEYHHVRGHQDDKGITLDIYETLNVRMDSLAKRRRETYETEHTPRHYQHMKLPNELWYLRAGEHKLCRHLNTHIYEHISFQTISKYWSKDEENGGRHVESVDWEGVKLAINQLPKHRQHWISKHVFGECGVNEVLKLRKEKDTDLCKRCGEIETTAHVWHCKAPEVSRLWLQSIESLKVFLTDINTDPSIISDISSHLLLWYNGNDAEATAHISPCPLQDIIGWNYVVEGWISIEWRQRQAHYFTANNKRNSVRRWVSALILKIWEIAWDLWEHRNGIEHEHRHEELHAQLDFQITQEIANYTLGEYPPMDHMFGDLEVEKLKSSTSGYKKAWLRNVKGANIKKTRTQTVTGIRGMQQLMRNFLTTETTA
jgi:hypothetical protein